MWARFTVYDTAMAAITASAKTIAAVLKYLDFICAPPDGFTHRNLHILCNH
jgi:hypothetical protein